MDTLDLAAKAKLLLLVAQDIDAVPADVYPGNLKPSKAIGLLFFPLSIFSFLTCKQL